MRLLMKVLARDKVDLIIFISTITLAVLNTWIDTGYFLFLLAGYNFYVMYRMYHLTKRINDLFN